MGRHIAKKVIAGVAAGALFGLGACGGSGSGGTTAEANTSTKAQIKNFDFTPEPIEISQGATVTWTNEDDILHTITSGIGQKQGVPGVSEDKGAKPDGLFDREMDGVGAEFSFTFDEAGEYRYYCAIHPGMRGIVVVD